MNKKLLQGWNLITLSAVTFIIYLIVAWFVQNPAAFITPDEGSKFLQMQNLGLSEGSFIYHLPYPGQQLDPALRFAPQNSYWGLRVQDGGLYLDRISLFGLLVRPFYDLFGFPGLYLLPALSGVACSLLTILLLKPNERRFEMWLLIAFGSPIFIYSTLFWEHTMAVALGLLALWLSFRQGSSRLFLRWLFIGLLLGIAIFLRLEMIIFSIAFIVSYLIYHPQKRGPLLVLGLLALSILLYSTIHQALYGQPWPANTRFLLRPFVYFQNTGWLAIKEILIGPAEEGAIDTGWLGGLWAIAALIAIVHSFINEQTAVVRRLIIGATIITMVIAIWFLRAPTNYYSAHGLLFTTPWALLGITRANEWWQQGSGRQKIIVATLILGLVGYTLSMIGLRAVSPQGGLEWGARYAMVFFPLLALIAGWNITLKKNRLLYLGLIAGMVFLGLAFQVRGILANRQSKLFNEALYEQVREQPDEHILFNEWWLPFNAAPIYTEKNYFFVSNATELNAWVQLAQQNDIRTFSLITTRDELLGDAGDQFTQYELEIIFENDFNQMTLYHLLIQPRVKP